MKKKLLIFSLVFTCVFFNCIFADSNGIWHYAKDIKPGIFGSDELDLITHYKFINNVDFDSLVKFNGDVGFNSIVDFNSDVKINQNIIINKKLKLGNYFTVNLPVCDSSNYGVLIYDLNKKKPFVCSNDGNKWKPLDSDFDEDGIVDWNDWDDNVVSKKSINLTPENIKFNISIFGVKGNLTCDNDNSMKEEFCNNNGGGLYNPVIDKCIYFKSLVTNPTISCGVYDVATLADVSGTNYWYIKGKEIGELPFEYGSTWGWYGGGNGENGLPYPNFWTVSPTQYYGVILGSSSWVSGHTGYAQLCTLNVTI